MSVEGRLLTERFPRSNRYHPDWIVAGASGGANVLWLTEWLSESLDLRPGMRVLDLGCGLASSSIFLRREFGVEVWATDLWFPATTNAQRIEEAGVADGVFPVQANARDLPFANAFFDAIVSVDSYYYYGTDDLYLNYIARLLKPGGQLGIAGAGLSQEITGAVPAHLQRWWEPGMWCLHSASWWRRHWERTGIVEIALADALADGWRWWKEWLLVVAPDNVTEIETLDADQGQYIGYVRVVARRREGMVLDEPVTSIPCEHVPRPLLRPDM